MRDFAMVKKVEGKLVQVVPLFSDACVVCASTDCAGHGKTFNVLNKQNFKLNENSIVRIGVPKLSQYIQGISALLIPILCAVSGYILAPALAQRFSLNFSDFFQAICVLVFFLAACLCVLIISRSSIHISLPEILQVLQLAKCSRAIFEISSAIFSRLTCF